MRVLILNHFPLEGSGSGIYTHNLARELTGMGCAVEVIYPEHEPKVYEGFSSRVVTFRPDEELMVDADGNRFEGPYDLPFNFPCFTTHPRSNHTFYDLTQSQIERYIEAFKSAMMAAIEEFKPDVVHAQHLWLMPYIAAQFDIPYIVTAHGTDLKGFVKDDRYHPYALEGARKASYVISISKQVDAEMKRLYGIENERTELILNGFDENLFKPIDIDLGAYLNVKGIKGDYQKAVVFAGKLAEFKGVDILLRAYAAMEHKEKVCLLIAGHGDQYEMLQNLKAELGVESVYFLGHLGQQELVAFYNIGAVSVVPSRNEPFGLVAIEALACGTPVVGTNQGGLPDFLLPQVGSLVPVEDVEALKDAIQFELSLDAEVMSARRSACRRHAEEGFSWHHAIIRVKELYERSMR